MDEKPRKKSGFFRILLILLLVAVAISAIALALRGREAGGLRGLWHSIAHGDYTEDFYYENASDGAFGDLNGGLAVLSPAGLTVFEGNGGAVFTRLFSWSSPAMDTAGKYGVAYNIGGKNVVFFDDRGVILELATEYPVVSASVNASGYLAVCTEESGYLGAVTVYNGSGTAIYRWRAGSGRVLSADVRTGSELLILTVGSGGSRLVLQSLASEEMKAEYVFPGLMIGAAFTDGGVTAVTTESVLYLSDDLEERAVYDFAGRYLAAFDMEDTYTALSLSDFQVGGIGVLVTLDQKAEELGRAAFSEDILSLDARGDTIAVLYTGRVETYGRTMEDAGRFDCDAGMERVLVRSDGSILTAGAFSAHVYSAAGE